MAEQEKKEAKAGAEKSAAGKTAETSAPDQKKKKKPEEVNTRPLPVMITLAAAAISCIMSLMQHVELGEYVGRLLITVIIFGAIGIAVRVVLDRWFLNPKARAADDEDAEAAAAASEKAAEGGDEDDGDRAEDGEEDEG